MEKNKNYLDLKEYCLSLGADIFGVAPLQPREPRRSGVLPEGEGASGGDGARGSGGEAIPGAPGRREVQAGAGGSGQRRMRRSQTNDLWISWNCY